MNGTFSFGCFALTIYLPTVAILIPVIFAGRYLVGRYEIEEPGDAIRADALTLSGENKLDILKLHMTDLVALEAANNNATVYYLLEGQPQKKLLRSSLRIIHETVTEMLQVHRSYLVILQHFEE